MPERLFHFSAGPFSALEAFTDDHRAERPFPEEDPGSDGDARLPPASQLEGLKNFLQQILCLSDFRASVCVCVCVCGPAQVLMNCVSQKPVSAVFFYS